MRVFMAALIVVATVNALVHFFVGERGLCAVSIATDIMLAVVLLFAILEGRRFGKGGRS